MGTELILKIAGLGLIVSASCTILQKSGRDEQATLVSIAGVVIVLLLIVSEMDTLFTSVRSIFGL